MPWRCPYLTCSIHHSLQWRTDHTPLICISLKWGKKSPLTVATHMPGGTCPAAGLRSSGGCISHSCSPQTLNLLSQQILESAGQSFFLMQFPQAYGFALRHIDQTAAGQMLIVSAEGTKPRRKHLHFREIEMVPEIPKFQGLPQSQNTWSTYYHLCFAYSRQIGPVNRIYSLFIGPLGNTNLSAYTLPF